MAALLRVTKTGLDNKLSKLESNPMFLPARTFSVIDPKGQRASEPAALTLWKPKERDALADLLFADVAVDHPR